MRVILYTDNYTREITKYTINVSITRTILEPYESARIECVIPAEISDDVLPRVSGTGAYDLSPWVVIYDTASTESIERAQFIGRLASVNSGFYAVTNEEGHGMIRARSVQLRCEGWLYSMREGQIYLSSQSTIDGHILDLDRYGERFRNLASLPFETPNVGAVLSRFFEELAPSYRLPLTLEDGRNFEQWAIVLTQESDVKRIASRRLAGYAEVYGLALNAVGGLTGVGSTAWGVIRSIFSGDPNMIELFSSLEPNDDAPLGVSPVIMYRLRPFRFGDHLFTLDTSTALDMVQGAAKNAVQLRSHEIISVDLMQTDSDRVNGVYVDTPLTQSRGVELFGVAGDPYFDEDDIKKSGLRLYRGRWPFFPQGQRDRKREGFQAQIQNVIDIAAQVLVSNHDFFNGTLQGAQRLDVAAGMWVSVELRLFNETKRLVCYVESVTHQTTARPSGEITRRSTYEFVRGFYDS